MKKICMALACAPVALLAACGGADSSGGPMTAAPPPSVSSPSSPSSSTTTGNTSLTNLTVSETFSTASATMRGRIAEDGTPSDVVSTHSGMGNAVTVDYDVTADSYTVNVNQGGIVAADTFGPVDYDDVQSTAQLGVFTKTSAAEARALLLAQPGVAGTGLSYVTFGTWQHLQGATTIETEMALFVAGVRTPMVGMPTGGMASYDGVVLGFWTDITSANSLGGTANIVADFDNGTMTGHFELTGTNLTDFSPNPFDNLNGAATISGTGFSGPLSGESTSFSGTSAGGFFGPDGQEVGGSFRVTDGFGGNAVGVFTGGWPK